MFFKKGGSASSGNAPLKRSNTQSSTDDSKSMGMTADLSSSGYESLLSSSLNDSYSTSLEYVPQNNKRLPEEDVLALFSDTGDKDIMIHENKDNESESKTTEQPCGGSFLQKNHEVKADAPSQEPTDMQGTHIGEMEEQSQRSNVPGYEDLSPHQNDPFTKTKTPLENRCGSTDMQETHIHEMKEQPQRFNVPNVPMRVDVSLSQYNPFTKKEPLEDGLGRTDMKEPCTDKIDEQLIRSNVPMHEDESLYKKEQITKKETPLEDGLGSTDMQDTNFDEIDVESQRSNVPMHAASLHQDESIIKNKMPLEDRCGNMNMQHNEQANSMQVNPEPFSLKQLQDYSPGSASEYTQSNGTESLAQYKNTAILAPNRNVKDRTEATKKREKSKCQKEKKKKLKDGLLRDWALRQCNDRKEELKNILDQISIINMAEHSDYPCFTAEDVMVYKNLTPESQIIFIADDNTSINTKTMLHYHMFVCNIKKAILLGPKIPNEQEIQYIESKVPIDTCTGFIFKAFAPALTVYKKIQKEEKLYSLI
ncbi:hypothetical protein PDJAM_G00101470 [Pangasius djambal]|uniref:Uncharacterized protein n=1 Tax=Pangasius djambal TaxID=1691987 RepID=A0ACC5Z7D1_9TELE|nr:hypothetical protein [Pangasius djambal]